MGPRAPMAQPGLAGGVVGTGGSGELGRSGVAETLDVAVYGLAGQLCRLRAEAPWPIGGPVGAKAAIEAATGIPAAEQRLLAGTVELSDDATLGEQLVCRTSVGEGSGALSVDLSLVRRQPTQARWIANVGEGIRSLVEAPLACRADAEIVLAAVRRNWRELEFASSSLRSDPAVVMAAIVQDWRALRLAHRRLRRDQSIVLAALAQDVSACEFSSRRLWADRRFVLAAVAIDGKLLRHCAVEIIASSDVIGTALKQRPTALEAVRGDAWECRSFVLAAVAVNGMLLQRASIALRADLAVVTAAAKCDLRALLFADPQVRLRVEAAITKGTELARVPASSGGP